MIFFVTLSLGRGESLLSLAKLALDSNFDSKAVDLISVALSDFTRSGLSSVSFLLTYSPLVVELLCSDHLLSVTGT